jgi:DNA-binding PadR family transcriptional regulator
MGGGPALAHFVMLIYKITMTQEPLGGLEHLILLALVRLGPEAYGVPIVAELRRHSRRPILPPSVYLALRRLESKGLVRSRLGDPEPRRGGRARRCFEVTAPGRKALRESHRTLTSLWDGVVLDKK